MWTFATGASSPIPTEPVDVMRSLSVPSVVTLKCPSDPVSTTSAFVFPSVMASDAIVLQVGDVP